MGMPPTDKASDKFARVAALRPARQKNPGGAERESTQTNGDAGELARLLGAAVERNRYGEHLVIRRWYPTPEPCLTNSDARAARALRLLLPNGREDSKAKRDLALASDPAEWLFLDTETTGLAGGSGTYAFLVGLAWWDSGGLQVEQYFMRDFGEEHSLLLAIDEHMAKRRVLVTFNGKSFDWPLLETRFRMTRAIPPRFPAAHLDLLHPARQLWRPRLNSVRLSELERHVLCVSPGSKLDWTREFDVDSAMIPEFYFNYVRSGAAEPLVPVFHHNQMDLRGLAALAGRIFEMIAGSQSAAHTPEGATIGMATEHPLDLYGLSRLLDRRGEPVRARKACSAALKAGLPAEHDRAARRDLAKFAKRAGDLPGAVELWESILKPARPRRVKTGQIAAVQTHTLERILQRGDGDPAARSPNGGQLRAALEACEQLAIHFEHHARALDRATEFTRQGLTLLERAGRGRRMGDISATAVFCRKWEARLARRLARLETRASRAPQLSPSQNVDPIPNGL
jgi:uncharacterized protein YprB with RNaseH-like and TPR domain